MRDLIEELTQGIKEAKLAWYNSSKRSSAKYYSVLTIDEESREAEKETFPGRYGRNRTFPVLYLGKGFKGIEGKRPGTWKTGEDRIKVEEMIARKLGKFTDQGLIPPVSIRLYPESTHETVDYYALQRYLNNSAVPYDSFIVVIEAECL